MRDPSFDPLLARSVLQPTACGIHLSTYPVCSKVCHSLLDSVKGAYPFRGVDVEVESVVWEEATHLSLDIGDHVLAKLDLLEDDEICPHHAHGFEARKISD